MNRNTLSLKNLLHTIPFIRILAGFTAGIIFANSLQIDLTFYITGIAVLFLLVVCFLHYNQSVFKNRIISILLIFILFFAGYNRFIQTTQKPDSINGDYYIATLFEKPILKTNSFKAETVIDYYSSNDSIYKSQERIIAYLQSDSLVSSLSAGDQILFSSQPSLINNPGNPFEFNYKKYLSRRNIYRQVYIPSGKWKPTIYQPGFSLYITAEKFREKLLSIYRDYNIEDEKFAILSALTLGYKEALDPEVKEVFSSTGAMHVLAVSGLHVGIIFISINLLFGFLKKNKKSKYLFFCISLSIIWIYAFITGLSPSVLRAATMFSIVLVGDNLRRPVNIYNTLTASAFILLYFNPNLLYEVGFQLSYTAVFGIVFFQPKMYKLLSIKNWIIDKVWALFTVSIAAQVSTLPLTIYYFNQYPTYSVISNFIVIPAAFIFIFLGMAILITSPIKEVCSIFAEITKYLLEFIYNALKWIQEMPGAVIKNIEINNLQFILLILFILTTMAFVAIKHTRYIYSLLTLLIIFFTVNLFIKCNCINQHKLIVYNTRGDLLIHLITGRKNYILHENDKSFDQYDWPIINNTICCLHLDQPILLNSKCNFEDSDLFISSGFISFCENHIILSKTVNNSNLPCNYIICQSINQSEIADSIQYIVCKSFIHKTLNNSNIHQLSTDGAFFRKL